MWVLLHVGAGALSENGEEGGEILINSEGIMSFGAQAEE